MRLGTDTGNLMNHIHANIGTHTAKVGDGATILCWTDRHAATVVKVTPTQIHVREDNAIRTDGNQMSDSQSYRYEPNPNARVQIFRKTKRGWRSSEGTGLMVGHRDEYYDYSF